jgi:SAM-dependent methyltransferase
MTGDVLMINRQFYDDVYHPKHSFLKFIWVKYYSFSVRMKIAPILSELRDVRNKKILEIGFGWGLNLIALAKNNRVYGLEISQSAINFVTRMTKRKGLTNVHLDFYQGTGVFPYQEEFDIVISSHVLEHVPNDDEFLKQNYDLLKPQGLMVLQIPIRQDVNYNQDPNHAREYTEESITTKLRSMGFRIVTIINSGYSISYFDKSANRAIRVLIKSFFLLLPYKWFLRFEGRVFGGRYVPTQSLFVCAKD